MKAPLDRPASVAPKSARAVGPGGFTLAELLVLVAVVAVLLSIFIPYLQALRETSHRAGCANMLRSLWDAVSHYADDNAGVLPMGRFDPAAPQKYAAFTGVDEAEPFAADSEVAANDVTASLWLLVRGGYASPRQFICPATTDRSDLLTDARGQPVEPAQRGNFRYADNLSYSYASPFSIAPGFRIDREKPGGYALLADRNPGIDGTQGGQDVTAVDRQENFEQHTIGNSLNHRRAGQNVLYVEGSVVFQMTPLCGVQLVPDVAGQPRTNTNDNIYTVQARAPLEPGQLPTGSGMLGRQYAPASETDSYLVPTAQDTPATFLAPRRPRPSPDVAAPPDSPQPAEPVTPAEPATPAEPSTPAEQLAPGIPDTAGGAAVPGETTSPSSTAVQGEAARPDASPADASQPQAGQPPIDLPELRQPDPSAAPSTVEPPDPRPAD